MNFLRRLIFALVYALPAVLFFSYYPVIRLGGDATMNFELSLPLLWLVVFDVLAFITLIAQVRHKSISAELTGLSDRRFFLFALFPLFATISIFWSANPTRAILTAGIIWLLFFAVFVLIYVLPLLGLPQHFRRNILYSLFGSSALICLFCWLQSFLDIAGVGREQTLLCLGCTYSSFGFPHPSGFAIEPQFMGNLLLAPTLAALYLLIFPTKVSTPRSSVLICLACLYSATLFLTFSRGAIYAYAVALILLFIFALIKRVLRPSLIIIPIATFAFTLCWQGIFTVIGPTHGSFISGVTKSIHQLTLGVVDLRPAPEESVPAGGTSLDQLVDELDREASVFEGYVEESTNIRLGLNAVAFNTWLQTPRSILLGVGLGAAGTAMHEAFPETITSPKEIVQNQAFSILLELGAVGIFLVHFGLVLAFLAPLLPPWFVDGRLARPRSPAEPKSLPARLIYRLRQGDFWSHPALPLLCALIVAYVVTLSFFSGLPNALHIYLLPPLLYLIFRKTTRPKHPCAE